MARIPVFFLASSLALVAGCSSPGGPDVSIDPIQIDSVDVIIFESLPPQVSVRVQGVIGDGCSDLHSTTQVRSGSTVRVTVLRQRPRDAVCTQIAKLYDQVIRLEGTYPAGRYTVRVNDVEKAFTTS